MTRNSVGFLDRADQRCLRALPDTAFRYLVVRNLVVHLAVTVAGGALLSVWSPGSSLILFGVLCATVVVSLILEIAVLDRLRVRWTRYLVSPSSVTIERGWWMRRTVVLPVAQIINVDVREGPLLRRCGLVTVQMRCLTVIESLGPLDPLAAWELRTVILTGQGAGAGNDEL